MPNKRGDCRTCDEWKTLRPDGECMACYQYRRRTGQDRPEAVVVAHNLRVLARG